MLMWFETDPDDVTFPTGACPGCDRQVLIYRDLNDEGDEITRCLDCGELLEAGSDAWTRSDVVEQGYRFSGDEVSEHKGSCGNCGT